jgi:hypothetical protein
VVGGVVALALIGGLIFWLRRRKHSCVLHFGVADSSEDDTAYRTVSAFTGGRNLEAGEHKQEVEHTPVSTDGSQHHLYVRPPTSLTAV